MNQEQLKAAFKLLLLMDGDAIAQSDANTFGNWYEHLSEHLLEEFTQNEEN